MPTRHYSLRPLTLLGICAYLCGGKGFAATDDLASLSLAELMDEPVTSVSKKQTKLSDSAAAITVITQEDFKRLGVTSLPDALRLVPGMDVGRISSNEWAVSARGFNGEFANKLLVLIDGRTVYTPSSAGVFWNAQDLMLEDIDRIEVIRGPGATLWGSNAVNGVINITTKRARDTEGVLISALGDSEPASQWAARYGGHVGSDVSFRAYVKYLDQAGLENSTDTADTGGWHTTRGGFRLDWDSTSRDAITLQGDAYGGRASGEVTSVSLTPPSTMSEIIEEDNSGQNILGRWTHTFATNSLMTIQGYVDHAIQGDGNSVEHRTTYDINLEHQFAWENHEIVWGSGYRSSLVDDVSHSFGLMWNPADQDIHLFNFFAQDDVTLIPSRLRATLGAKFEKSNLVAASVEPNVRLMWTPVEHQAIWAAISNAQRTPALFELHGRANAAAFQPAPDAPPILISELSNPTLKSEQVVAYEVGYRYTPGTRVAVDISTYFNDYTHVITATPLTETFEDSPTPPHELFFVSQVNAGRAQTYGTEATLLWQVAAAAQMVASYDWTHISRGDNPIVGEGTASQQAQLRFYVDLPHEVQLNSAFLLCRSDNGCHRSRKRTYSSLRPWRFRRGLAPLDRLIPGTVGAKPTTTRTRRIRQVRFGAADGNTQIRARESDLEFLADADVPRSIAPRRSTFRSCERKRRIA